MPYRDDGDDFLDDFDGDDFPGGEDLFGEDTDSEGDWGDDWCGADEAEPDDDFDGADDQGADFTWKEAFFLGGAMGWAYEEGMGKRKKRKGRRWSKM